MATSRTGTAAHKQFRLAVLTRDRNNGVTHCPITGCGVELNYRQGRQLNSAEPDHIIPHSRGGTDHPDNGRTICRNCNQRRGNRTSDPQPPRTEPVTGLIAW